MAKAKTMVDDTGPIDIESICMTGETSVSLVPATKRRAGKVVISWVAPWGDRVEIVQRITKHDGEGFWSNLLQRVLDEALQAERSFLVKEIDHDRSVRA